METELKTAIWKIANAAIEMHEDRINGKEFEEFSIKALKAVKNNAVLPLVSNSALIDYIENDAEIAMPIDEMFNEDSTNITKKKYGKVLLKYLVKELREHYC